MHVTSSLFTLPKGGILLGFAMQAEGNGPAGATSMTMVPHGNARDRIVLHTDHRGGGVEHFMLARVSRGSFDVRMSRGQGAEVPLAMDVYLAGDVNGDHRVDRQDLRMVRDLLGRRQGQLGHSLAADVDLDGVINVRDWRLARLNLGAATQVRPLSVSAALAPASDPDGNGVVTRPDVMIVGQTAPGATVRLFQVAGGSAAQVTTADSHGNYQFPVVTGIGVTPFRVEADDAFGQQATADMSVTHGDVVIAWDETMLDAIRADRTTLGLSTRTMAMEQAAIYDAVNAIDHIGAVFQVGVAAAPGASPEAAASEAAYRVLVSIYPAQEARFDATLAESLATVPDKQSKADGIAVGSAVADGILAWRVNDGSSAQVPYTPGTAPGEWRPTPPGYQVAWGPEWGQVTPFAIANAAQFLPPPPPSMDSPDYTAAFNEVKSVGALDSTTRTPEQTLIGHFWAYDRAGMGPPPVLYNQIVEAVALQQHNTLDQNARLFALSDIAMADSGIVAWDAKYQYNLWRPVTAIRLADTDGNPDTVADPTWTPLGAPGGGVVPDFTPPFPAYVSGHATFGAAIFQTLADFYGTDNITFTIGSDELPGVYRTYHGFSAAVEENGQSRIYLGIHWSFDKTEGIATGDSIANYVFQHAFTPAG